MVGQSHAQVQFDTTVQRVISSGGSTASVPWGTVDYTIGEAIITSDTTSSPFSSVKWLTQGFQQPAGSGLIIKVVGVNATCIGGRNGSASIAIRSASGLTKCSWNGGGFDTKFLFDSIPAGTYSYTVKDDRFSISGTVTIAEDSHDCDSLVKFYHGITVNGDGINDKWIIDGIENFPENSVAIFNRWGDEVWSCKNYDNESRVWEGTNKSGAQLPDGTYFYIFGDNKRQHKGWIELSH